MNSELEVLKKIWENNGKTYITLISHQAGFGIDYTRYICHCLFKKGQIKPVKKQRDWYIITAKGKRELKLRQLIKLKASRKASNVEKAIYYLPKKLEIKFSKSNFQEASIKKPKIIEAEEKNINLGRNIEKAVSFLKRSTKEG